MHIWYVATRLSAGVLTVSVTLQLHLWAMDFGKRLATLRQARSFVDWEKRRAFVKDLGLVRESDEGALEVANQICIAW